jgi:hypothetical protein
MNAYDYISFLFSVYEHGSMKRPLPHRWRKIMEMYAHVLTDILDKELLNSSHVLTLVEVLSFV